MFPAGRSDVATRAVDLAGGITLRVAESGSRESPVILLLHGWGASIYMWRDLFAPLAAAGFWGIAIDLPGHRLAGKPDGLGGYTMSGSGGRGGPLPGVGGNGSHGRGCAVDGGRD